MRSPGLQMAEKVTIADFFTKLLTTNVEAWWPYVSRNAVRLYRSATATEFGSLDLLVRSVNEARVRDGDPIIVTCRPAPYGPFLRRHVIPFARMKNTHYVGPVPLFANAGLNIMSSFTTSL